MYNRFVSVKAKIFVTNFLGLSDGLLRLLVQQLLIDLAGWLYSHHQHHQHRNDDDNNSAIAPLTIAMFVSLSAWTAQVQPGYRFHSLTRLLGSSLPPPNNSLCSAATFTCSTTCACLVTA